MMEMIKRFFGFGKEDSNGKITKRKTVKIEVKEPTKKRCTEVDALEAENKIFQMARHEHETLQGFKTSSINLQEEFKKIKKKHESGNFEVAG